MFLIHLKFVHVFEAIDNDSTPRSPAIPSFTLSEFARIDTSKSTLELSSPKLEHLLENGKDLRRNAEELLYEEE